MAACNYYMAFTITCNHCGKLNGRPNQTEFLTLEAAELVASRHVERYPKHTVTGTRPAHKHEGSIPVIVFTAKKQEEPHA